MNDKNTRVKQKLYDKKKLRNIGSVVALLLVSMTDASATSGIFASAKAKGIKVTSCQSCHTGAAGSESKGNLKPGYLAAYNLDKTGLTRLKLLINGATTIPFAVNGSVGLVTSGIAKSDVYAVTCAAGTARLYVHVLDLAPVKAPLVSIQATKGAVSTALSTDARDGDAVFSPLVGLAGGAGVYTVKVNKSASAVVGAETYQARLYCRNAANTPTGISWRLTQNQ